MLSLDIRGERLGSDDKCWNHRSIESESEKLQGVVIDSTLTFSEHVNQLYMKASSSSTGSSLPNCRVPHASKFLPKSLISANNNTNVVSRL